MNGWKRREEEGRGGGAKTSPHEMVKMRQHLGITTSTVYCWSIAGRLGYSRPDVKEFAPDNPIPALGHLSFLDSLSDDSINIRPFQLVLPTRPDRSIGRASRLSQKSPEADFNPFLPPFEFTR